MADTRHGAGPVLGGEQMSGIFAPDMDWEAAWRDAATADVAEAFRGFRHSGFVSLRWVMTHMIEEYARHLGHADLLQERLDGSTGELAWPGTLAHQVVQNELPGPPDRPRGLLVDQVEVGTEATPQVVGAEAGRSEQAPGRRRIADAGQVEVAARLGHRRHPGGQPSRWRSR
jgi:Protein of unknown function (DUF664)